MTASENQSDGNNQSKVEDTDARGEKIDEETGSDSSDKKSNLRSKLAGEFRIDTKLLSYKAFYFLFFGGFGSSFPYMSLYFRQIGLNASLVGLLAGIRPLIQFASAPFWSVISDKFKARKAVLLFSIVAWIVMTLALLLPQPRNTVCREVKLPIAAGGRGRSDIPEPELETEYFQDEPKLVKSNNGQFEIVSKTGNRWRVTRTVNTSKDAGFLGGNDTKSRHFELIRDPHEIHKVFMWLMILVVGGEFLEAPTFILADTALLQKLQEKRKHYGKTRLFGSLGYATASFIVGAVLETTRFQYCGETHNDYKYLFYIFAGVMLLALLFAAVLFEFTYEDDGNDGKVDECAVWKILLQPKYAFFMTIAWFLGFSNGLIFNFLNWYLEDLGASKLLMGSATTMRAAGLLIAFFVNSYLTDRLGHICVSFLSILSYFSLFVWLAVMRNPWLAFPLEFLEGLTYGTSWSTCVTYMADATPMSGAATMQGILQGVYWGLGGGLGAILGGVVIDEYGAVPSFYAGGVLSFALLIAMSVIHVCMEKKRKDVKREWTPIPFEEEK
ncbi:predicted protein [Nematostella vectensis]|uniref:Major facilitator superfamily (MFS) profile domain-containing protein n=1 Tax=Nematostella vectensis TaxID=45351 RepID=A7RI07_NEMVE|nr:major facilitator superfamily domain-containing protein 6 [Nematostella vectensis]EDO48948.1 predicted protein [Nematostella vectensis]|eukprot:XP_001641011.1 predicted protein [Nematostella vectensis]